MRRDCGGGGPVPHLMTISAQETYFSALSQQVPDIATAETYCGHKKEDKREGS